MKKDYFQKLNIKDFTDDKNFWKTIKSFFSNKGLNSNKVMLRGENVNFWWESFSHPDEQLFC